MRILLTNDDGVESEGIHILARELRQVADLLMAVPLVEKSGTSHGITLGRPVEYKELDPRTGIPGYVVSGTPVDCVRLAHEVFEEPFDLVVSGINAGANVGLNVHYSGTVAAAMEAAFLGRMGLAVSISTRRPRHFETAAVLAADLARRMLERGEPLVLNLNVPDLPLGEVRGVRVTRTSTTEEETALGISENSQPKVDECDDTKYVLDSRALRAGFVSVTPLELDMTACDKLKTIQAWGWQGIGR